MAIICRPAVRIATLSLIGYARAPPGVQLCSRALYEVPSAPFVTRANILIPAHQLCHRTSEAVRSGPCDEAGGGSGTLTAEQGGHVLVESGQLRPADQIASELARLGRGGASGAVEIEGQPSGIVYLRHGRLAFAESPAVPDLGTRLIRSRRLPPGVWDQIARDHHADGAVGAALVGRALITRAELRRLLRSITFDSLLALTAPFAGECSVSGIWLAPQRSHWAQTVLAMDVASVRRYLEHMTQQLAWYDVTPRWRPRWSALRRPEALVNSSGTGHRQPDRRADSGQRPGEVCVAAFPCHETMDAVGQLVHAGTCTLPLRMPFPRASRAGRAAATGRADRGPRDAPGPRHAAGARPAAAGPAGTGADGLTPRSVLILIVWFAIFMAGAPGAIGALMEVEQRPGLLSQL